MSPSVRQPLALVIVRLRHPVALDQLQAPGRVELLHDHDRRPVPLQRHRPDEGRGVVQRRRAQVHDPVPVALADPAGDDHRGRRRVAERRSRQLLAHPLRPPGGAGRVEHLPPLALILQRPGRPRREHVVVPLEPRQLAAGADQRPDHRQVEPRDHVRQRLRRDQRDRARVVEHVLHLGRAQVAVDRRVPEPGALRGPRHLKVGAVVLHADRDRVALGQPARRQRPRQPGGPVLELRVADGLAGRAHDDGRRGRRPLGVPARRQRRCTHSLPPWLGGPGGNDSQCRSLWKERSSF
jgi:hypothetical protein